MDPLPGSRPDDHRRPKLEGRVAVITGGDSGIGRAVARAFAEEGASVALSYLSEEHEGRDARETAEDVRGRGGNCLLLSGDIRSESVCRWVIAQAVERFGRVDILVNNAGVHYPRQSIADIERADLLETFETNVFAMLYLTAAALQHLRRSAHASVINTASVTAYRGSEHLVDYAASKGAVVAFTRSLSKQLVGDGIRVNAVAPGPIWTPLIPASFDKEKVARFGSDVPMRRAGEPRECAPAYVYLASDDSSYVTGQVLHVNGGEIVNG